MANTKVNPNDGVVCWYCATWYSRSLRKPGERCGDLSQGQPESQDGRGCPGQCQTYTRAEEIAYLRGIRRALDGELDPVDWDIEHCLAQALEKSDQ